MQIVVAPGGGIRCVYDESIDLSLLGKVQISRGSHVEPSKESYWFADLAPVGGPSLGPFLKRTDAMAAEVAWLEENWLFASER
ncbi:hypothetical protein [Bremerella alba]|uniref:Uncharacterized protein n=1 Tax=Bremerella alba TaxID=980252 RepID=A0A7V8V722_9BACT|nr:hypothetical protein [Bremerella alba]MBA2116110.1 hypothetical protein [Bremerella alba]